MRVCTLCRRADHPLEQCYLTGSGDHPRQFLLCAACLKSMLATSPGVEGATPPPGPTMSETEKHRETRRQKAFQRLGSEHPRCACCGETDWRCMELHHLEGEQFGKTLVIVCRNCHRKLSDAQKDHPPEFGEPPTTEESISHFLEGLADLLILIARKIREFAAYLLQQAHSEPARNKEARQ